MINKCTFFLDVGVFATPPQLACGRSPPPQKTGGGCAGRSGLVWDWAPLLPACDRHIKGKKNPNCQKSWEETP